MEKVESLLGRKTATAGKSRAGWRKISGQVLIILTVTFLVVLLFIAQLTYRYMTLSAQANTLARNLQNTFELNQELRSGIQEQINMVHRQFEQINPAFPHRLTQLNYELGAKQTRYVTLNIGSEERFTVESIRSLQSELSVEALQIFDQLRRGERNGAREGIARVEQLGERLEREFELLNRVQVEKLQAVLGGVRGSLQRTQLAIASLAASLVLVLGLVTLLLRRRVLQPLQELARASEQIRQGDLTVRSPVRREDEIGQLSQSFNFMAAALADNYATLERQVQARQQQLENLQSDLARTYSVEILSELIRGAAHELNNPVTAIASFAELQKMKVAATRRDADEIRILEDILAQADRCRRIVSNLLQVAAPSGDEDLLLGINGVIEPVVQLREYEMKRHNVRLVRDYAASNPIVQVDPPQLRQLVLTLLVTADQVVRDRFTAASVTVRTDSKEERAVIEIFSQGGPGKSDGAVPYSPAALSPVLALCSALAERLHGRLTGESRENGVVLTISLPLATSDQADAATNSNGMLRK
ncbi:MAG: HAMP domain-containing sensor histidine kinase [Acidobacteria bacterium]|nr:MAG: HAMP domain-containing sensor histidine kinase [Acidobacteriota bacterium]